MRGGLGGGGDLRRLSLGTALALYKLHIPIHFPCNRSFRFAGGHLISQSISPNVYLWAVMGQAGQRSWQTIGNALSLVLRTLLLMDKMTQY